MVKIFVFAYNKYIENVYILSYDWSIDLVDELSKYGLKLYDKTNILKDYIVFFLFIQTISHRYTLSYRLLNSYHSSCNASLSLSILPIDI